MYKIEDLQIDDLLFHPMWKNISNAKDRKYRKDPRFKRIVWIGSVKNPIPWKSIKKIGVFPCLLIFVNKDNQESYKVIYEEKTDEERSDIHRTKHSNNKTGNHKTP